MAVTSEQNVFVAWVLSWRKLLAVALNFVENRPQGAWRRSALCDVRSVEMYSESCQTSKAELFCENS